MTEMISLYLEQTPLLLNSIKIGFRDKDWNSLHTAAHKIIPSFSIMGISVNFENMAKKIQEYAIVQAQSTEMPDLLLQLEKVCTQACEELNEELMLIKNRNNAQR
jgi:hypothetical protein